MEVQQEFADSSTIPHPVVSLVPFVTSLKEPWHYFTTRFQQKQKILNVYQCKIIKPHITGDFFWGKNKNIYYLKFTKMCQINYIVIQQYEKEKTESLNDNLNLFNHFKRSSEQEACSFTLNICHLLFLHLIDLGCNIHTWIISKIHFELKL